MVKNLSCVSCAAWNVFPINSLMYTRASRYGKKSPNQENGFENRGCLKVLNDTKLILNDSLNHLGSIWYHSEPSDLPYSPNQFLGWDFFSVSYSKTALKTWID